MFKDSDTRPANIINLSVKLFDDMRYYNTVSNFFSSGLYYRYLCKFHEAKSDWFDLEPPREHWVEINADASKKLSTRSASVGYVMSDSHSKINMAKEKQIGEMSYSGSWMQAGREVIILVIQRTCKGLLESNSPLVINSIDGKIDISKDILMRISECYLRSFEKLELCNVTG